jgi:hypothetical protein
MSENDAYTNSVKFINNFSTSATSFWFVFRLFQIYFSDHLFTMINNLGRKHLRILRKLRPSTAIGQSAVKANISKRWWRWKGGWKTKADKFKGISKSKEENTNHKWHNSQFRLLILQINFHTPFVFNTSLSWNSLAGRTRRRSNHSRSDSRSGRDYIRRVLPSTVTSTAHTTVIIALLLTRRGVNRLNFHFTRLNLLRVGRRRRRRHCCTRVGLFLVHELYRTIRVQRGQFQLFQSPYVILFAAVWVY